MSIGPGAAKIGVPYLVEYEGEQWTGFRVPRVRPINSGVLVPPRREKETTAWFFMRHDDDAGFISKNSFYADDQDFGEIVPLVPSRKISRDDLPTAEEAKAAHDNWMAASKRADRAESERDEARESASRANEFAATCQRERDEWESNADELQVKLDAAENRPTLDREAVKTILFRNFQNRPPNFDRAEKELSALAFETANAWPEWLGPKIDPDDFEVTRDGSSYRAGTSLRSCMGADDAWESAHMQIRSAAKWVAIARFIESEQAATSDEDQRVEEQSKALARTVHDDPWKWDNIDEPRREHFRAAIRAGWTPPESEA